MISVEVFNLDDAEDIKGYNAILNRQDIIVIEETITNSKIIIKYINPSEE